MSEETLNLILQEVKESREEVRQELKEIKIEINAIKDILQSNKFDIDYIAGKQTKTEMKVNRLEKMFES